MKKITFVRKAYGMRKSEKSCGRGVTKIQVQHWLRLITVHFAFWSLCNLCPLIPGGVPSAALRRRGRGSVFSGPQRFFGSAAGFRPRGPPLPAARSLRSVPAIRSLGLAQRLHPSSQSQRSRPLVENVFSTAHAHAEFFSIRIN